MKIIFNETIPSVKNAVGKANELLASPLFYEGIKKQSKFDLANTTPAVIADLLKNTSLEFLVEIYYPNLFQSIKYRKTLAFTDARFPNTLFLNFKKLNREVEAIAATIIHESIHSLDDAADTYTFGHGNNSSVGKENTAPYWIGNYAYRFLKGNNTVSIVFDQVED
jgi:hypothetical protein